MTAPAEAGGEDAGLIARAKSYACDIQATHESLMLVGDLATRLAALAERVKELERGALIAERAYNGVAELLHKAEAESAALREQIAALSDALDYLRGLTPSQYAALTADAERYRCLCRHPDWHFIEKLCRSFVAKDAARFKLGLDGALDLTVKADAARQPRDGEPPTPVE